jgi:hypothetical protein
MFMDTLELVLRQSNGAILIPLKRAAGLIGREPQTLRNQLTLGKCPFEPVREGRSVFFRATDIANFIDGGHGRIARADVASQVSKPRLGAPANWEKQAAAALGLSVPDWRAHQNEART